jgi:hypothetical protein
MRLGARLVACAPSFDRDHHRWPVEVGEPERGVAGRHLAACQRPPEASARASAGLQPRHRIRVHRETLRADCGSARGRLFKLSGSGISPRPRGSRHKGHLLRLRRAACRPTSVRSGPRHSPSDREGSSASVTRRDSGRRGRYRAAGAGGAESRACYDDPALFGGGVIGNTAGSGPVIGGSSPPPRAASGRKAARFACPRPIRLRSPGASRFGVRPAAPPGSDRGSVDRRRTRGGRSGGGPRSSKRGRRRCHEAPHRPSSALG